MSEMTRAQALKILELDNSATDKEIKTAYRKLSKKYHPDINKDESAKDIYDSIVAAEQTLLPKEIDSLEVFVGQGARFKLGGHRAFEKSRNRKKETMESEEEEIKPETEVQAGQVESKLQNPETKEQNDIIEDISWTVFLTP